ncbi:MAG: hypothetical protein QM775_09960 [Pirellulales bacterium]
MTSAPALSRPAELLGREELFDERPKRIAVGGGEVDLFREADFRRSERVPIDVERKPGELGDDLQRRLARDAGEA